MLNKSTKKRYIFFVFSIIAIVAIFFVCINIPFNIILSFNNGTILTGGDLKAIQNKNYFGPFVTCMVEDNSTISTSSLSSVISDKEPKVIFRLFDLIPIKSQKIKLIKEDKVLAGGSAIGLTLKTEGVMIVGSSPVTTIEGEIDTLENSKLQVGDIITQIENEMVDSVESVSKIINKKENKNRELLIKGKRKAQLFTARVKPCYDIKSENYKLGVWVRDDASGVGTLTFIDAKNRFGALGHPICDSDTKSTIDLKEGKIYNCSILGVNKGTSGSPGELKGLFMQGKNEQGIVEKNNNYGVYGYVNNNSTLFSRLKETEIGSRLMVKPGKAQIRCCVDGEKIEDFNIEIIKTNFQNYSNDKSMVIRITDDRLIEKTGGIVQGMSGSPILQNGKLIGAVTHVFVNDPTKGFGVYIDWMLNQ